MDFNQAVSFSALLVSFWALYRSYYQWNTEQNIRLLEENEESLTQIRQHISYKRIYFENSQRRISRYQHELKCKSSEIKNIENKSNTEEGQPLNRMIEEFNAIGVTAQETLNHLEECMVTYSKSTDEEKNAVLEAIKSKAGKIKREYVLSLKRNFTDNKNSHEELANSIEFQFSNIDNVLSLMNEIIDIGSPKPKQATD